MQFLNPLGLLGLLSLPVIVGLHLHLERNRRVIVSSMYLWQFLDAKYQGEKPKFIKLSWLLILDLSIAMIFSFALAEPQLRLPSPGKDAVQRVILLDDSLSLMAEDGDPDRFEMAKDLIASLIEESQRQDETIVITFGGQVEEVGSTSDLRKAELIEKVMNLRPMGYGVELRGGLARGQALAVADLPLEVIVVTDAAFDYIDVSEFPMEIEWVFIGFEENNQAVLPPLVEEVNSGRRILFSRIANYASEAIERDIELQVDGEVIHTETLSLAARSLIPYEYPLPEEFNVIQIRLLGSDNLGADDRAVISYPTQTEVRVALIAEQTDPIKRAFAALPNAQLTVYAPGDEIPELLYDLIIYRGITPERVPAGTVVVFDPDKESPLLPVGNNAKISYYLSVEDHSLLAGVDFAGVRWDSVPVWSEESSIEWGNPISIIPLIKADDQPLLLEMVYPDGSKFIFLPELGEGNFTKSPAFPIFISNLVSYVKRDHLQTTYPHGKRVDLPSQYQSPQTLIKSPSEENYQVLESNEIELNEFGTYSLLWEDEYGDQHELLFGVNAGEIEESHIAPRDWRVPFSSQPGESSIDFQKIEVNLAPWLILAGMLLLGIEAWRVWR